MPRQVEKLQAYDSKLLLFTDIGSGLNCRKRGLRALIKLILTGQVKELVLTYKDRLLRFGSELVFLVCECFSVKVTILNETTVETMENQMSKDILAILTVFAARMHGARSHLNRKTKQTQLHSTI